jgi:hypothetical protein
MCQVSPAKKVKKGVVTFDKIKVHVFAPTIGDNPFVSGGVPIALGPKLHESVLPLDQYERERMPRRSIQELALNRNYRKEL